MYPRLMRKIRKQGHMLGNHSYGHPHVKRMSGDAVREELRRMDRTIRRLTGFRACAFRSPYGEDAPQVIAAAKSLGMVTTNWDVDPRDWENPGVSQIVQETVQKARNGSILLLHDGGGARHQSVAALPKIIKILRDRGFRFVGLQDMFDLDARYRKRG